MKTFFPVILAVLFCSIFGLAQIETPKSTDWKTFAPENEEFWIDIPVALDASLFKNDNSDDNFNRRYLNSFDGTYFYIFSDNPKTPGQFKYISEVLKTYDQTGKTENIGEFEAAKYSFSDNGDFYQTILTVKGKNRFYVFQTISPTKADSAVERFFGSIKLNGKLSAENFVEMKNEKDIIIKIPTLSSETEQSITKTENNPVKNDLNVKGRDENNFAKKSSTSKKRSKKTAELIILTKPPAIYTDFARFYEINGRVDLRVTFLANGTIGAITIVSKLPFGLTVQAVAAARGISFKPAMKDGAAYSVEKIIEYNFTLPENSRIHNS